MSHVKRISFPTFERRVVFVSHVNKLTIRYLGRCRDANVVGKSTDVPSTENTLFDYLNG